MRGVGGVAYLVLLPREIISRLHDAGDAIVEVSPASVVGAEDGEAVTGGEFKAEVDLAVFAGLDDVGFAAYFGGEVFVEDCGIVSMMDVFGRGGCGLTDW